MGIIAPDGKTQISTQTIEVNGFVFNKVALQNNPIELFMSFIMLGDMSPAQRKLLSKLDLVMKDVDGNIMFEPDEEEEENES